MKKETEGIAKERTADLEAKKMTRKEAIKKSGYIMVSAATTLILLSNPYKAHAASAPSPPY